MRRKNIKRQVPERNISDRYSRGSKRTENGDFYITWDAKKQIAGLFLIILGLLLFFSIISYSNRDNVTLERIGILDIFRKETYTTSFTIYNWLGVAGAFTAQFFVRNLFGYFSVIIPFIIVLFGTTLLIKKHLYRVMVFSIYAIIFMIIIASSAGFLKILFGKSFLTSSYSGTTGDYIASIFYNFLGSVGASVFFLFAIIIAIILIIDGNIIRTFARFKHLFDKILDSFRKEKKDFEEKDIVKEQKKKAKTSETAKTKLDYLEEELNKEKERIRRLKYSQDTNDDETKLIKETEINRPEEDTVLTAKIPEDKKKQKEIPLDSPEIKSLVSEPRKMKKEKDIVEDEIPLTEDTEEAEEEKLENYISPSLDLLNEPTKEEFEVISDEELNQNGRLLQEKLLKFGIEIEKVYATPGPVVTLYELIPAADVKLSKIEALQDDIALAMKAKGIRLIVPIPGKGTVGVEIPNHKSQIVRIRSILSSQKYKESKHILPIAFGKMINGEVYIDDLANMPHILIAGTTGSGKSVGINNIIASLLFKIHPSDLKLVLIDPKKIELSLYKKLRNHFLATSYDVNETIITTPNNAVAILKSVEAEMEKRYDMLANAGVRGIDAYNRKFSEGNLKNTDDIKHRKMPYIIVIIDELSDLMMTARRDIEEPIVRVAQMARAVGIHLILATQRPSVDVITGLIKANFPVRVAYQVISKIDSRTILDMGGAEQLLGDGDMLFHSASSKKPHRIQNALITTDECERIVEFISNQQGLSKPYLLPSSLTDKKFSYGATEDSSGRDVLFEEAVRLILKLQQCSVTILQRRLKLGYARAARIVDQMEQAGIVGPGQGAKGRDILITEDDLDNIL